MLHELAVRSSHQIAQRTDGHQSPEVIDPACSSSGSLLYHFSISKESKVNILPNISSLPTHITSMKQQPRWLQLIQFIPREVSSSLALRRVSAFMQHNILVALGFRVYAGVRSSKAAEQGEAMQEVRIFWGGRGRGNNVEWIVGVEHFEHIFFVFVLICLSFWKSNMIWWKCLPEVGIWKSDCRSSMTVRHKTLPQKIHQWLAGDLVPVILDVTLESTVQSAYETITKDLEQHALMLVGLVNCAGLSRVQKLHTKNNSEKKISPRHFLGVSIPLVVFVPTRLSKTPVFPPGVYHWNWNLWRWSKTFMKSPGDFWGNYSETRGST